MPGRVLQPVGEDIPLTVGGVYPQIQCDTRMSEPNAIRIIPQMGIGW